MTVSIVKRSYSSWTKLMGTAICLTRLVRWFDFIMSIVG